MPAPNATDIQQGVPQTANIVQRITAPEGGELLLDANGGIYAIGGAQYRGSYFDDRYLAAQHRNDPNRQFAGFEIRPDGGITLKTTQGNTYALDNLNQARGLNSLYKDPAFLAFLRSSDLGLETAAGDVARRTLALNQALANSVQGLQDQRTQALQNVDNGLEARGLYRSGRREVDRATQEQNYGNQIASAQQGTAQQIGDLNQSLAEKIAGQQQQAAEKGYNTAQMQELSGQQEALRAKYPAQFAAKA